MKLSEFLDNAGRPVAYYPRLAKMLGGVKCCVLFCQLYYWTDKTPDGWMFKTAADIEDETGLSPKEQSTARLKLQQLGLLEERHARLEHRLYYRLVLDALEVLWVKFAKLPTGDSGNSLSEIGQVTKGSFDIYTENTEEITEKRCMYSDHVKMKPAEHQKLVAEFGEEETKQFINRLDSYKGSTGKTYKNDYLAIRSWVIDSVRSKKGGPTGAFLSKSEARTQRNLEAAKAFLEEG